MEEVKVNGLLGVSSVYIGESISNLEKYIPKHNVFIITDKLVKSFYGDRFPKVPTYVIKSKETHKNLFETSSIYRWLVKNEADRSSFIIGIGGGITCDLAGFVASTFMRGVKFGFVSTTLLSQVDASVGGKNGVNFDGYKNIIGTINQPEFVICDIDLLATLPKNELRNGMAEVVKHALITDAEKFIFLEKNAEKAKSFDHEILRYVVTRSVHIKAQVVTADERETGVRRKLNLGHTWGHAVEKVTGIPHGQAVSIGMVFAARFSLKKGYITEEEHQRIVNLLEVLELPIQTKANPISVFEALARDKKRVLDSIHFVFMKGIGETAVELIKLTEIKSFIDELPSYHMH